MASSSEISQPSSIVQLHLGICVTKQLLPHKPMCHSPTLRVVPSWSVQTLQMRPAFLSMFQKPFGTQSTTPTGQLGSEERPIAYVSSTLTKTERGYTHIEKEALSLAVTNTCRCTTAEVGSSFVSLPI